MPFFKEIEHCGVTDVGVKRSHNQDAFTVQKAPDRDHWQRVGHLFIVADGMGGHAVGEKASAKAVQEIPLTYVKHVQDGPAAGPPARLPGGQRRDQRDRHSRTRSSAGWAPPPPPWSSAPRGRGSPTSATAGRTASAAAQIQQLTYDHSLRLGDGPPAGITPDELGDVKQNVIVRSLGPDPLVQVDVEGPHPMEDGRHVRPVQRRAEQPGPAGEIGAVVGVLPPEEAGRFLIDLANLRGGPDNITVVIVSGRDGAATRSRPPCRARGTAESDAPFGPAWPRRPVADQRAPDRFLLAVSFVVFAARVASGATLFFAVAASASRPGSSDCIMHSASRQRPAAAVPDAPTRASVYRQYPVRIDAGPPRPVDQDDPPAQGAARGP